MNLKHNAAYIFQGMHQIKKQSGNKLCLTLFLFISTFGYSTTNLPGKASLSGKITDKSTKETLVGATIYFPDLKRGVVTDKDGDFKIDNLPESKLLIQISLVGYKTIVEEINLTMVNNKNFEMQSSATELNQITVTGTSKATEMRKDPVPMVMIDSKNLEQNSSSNIIEALNKVPGLSSLSTGPNVAKPYIHGLGYNRILTLFDGVRQEGQQWGDEHGVEIDQFLINRIEVIKGPASLMYGSDALAGVVNLLPANAISENSIKGSYLSNYQSNNRQIANSLNLDGNTEGITWGFRASQKMATNFQNSVDGRVFGTKYNEKDLNAYIGLNRSWGYSHLNFSMYDNQQEIPDGSRDSATRKFTRQITEADTFRPIVSANDLNSYTINGLHQRVQHYRVFTDNKVIFSNSKIAFNVCAQQSVRREFAHPLASDIAGLYLILNTATYNAKYFFPEFKGIETTAGINGMLQNNNASKGTEMVIPSYKLFDFGSFLHLKKSFGKLDVSGGVRYDVRRFQNDSMFVKINSQTGFDMSTDFNPSDTSVKKIFSYYKHLFNGFSGSIGVTYNFNETVGIKCNIARGYRAPNASEISAHGVHPGTGFMQLGNPNFSSEFSLQEDAGFFVNSEHVSITCDVFHNRIYNYIFNQRLQSLHGSDSIFVQDGSPFPVFKFQQTTAQLFGGEASIDIHPHPYDWLHFENGVSFIYAQNLGGNGVKVSDSTKYLPLIQPFHTNTELRVEFAKKWKCFSNIFAKAGVQYFATQFRYFSAYGTETRTPSYTLIDAGLGADIVSKKGRKIFSISILGNNLADVAYQTNMSRLKYFTSSTTTGYVVPGPSGRYGIFSMGRNFSFKIVIPIDVRN
ncbi:MAG: TonB-dependent receptor [Bacteroidetes bacterium]|nr:TonB-dependent receptor [Bacteroidota bacterium]